MTVAERSAATSAASAAIRTSARKPLPNGRAIHRTQMTLIESGQRHPRIPTVIKLAGALGVDLNTLFAGVRWVPAGRSGPGHFDVEEGR